MWAFVQVGMLLVGHLLVSLYFLFGMALRSWFGLVGVCFRTFDL